MEEAGLRARSSPPGEQPFAEEAQITFTALPDP